MHSLGPWLKLGFPVTLFPVTPLSGSCFCCLYCSYHRVESWSQNSIGSSTLSQAKLLPHSSQPSPHLAQFLIYYGNYTRYHLSLQVLSPFGWFPGLAFFSSTLPTRDDLTHGFGHATRGRLPFSHPELLSCCASEVSFPMNLRPTWPGVFFWFALYPKKAQVFCLHLIPSKAELNYLFNITKN